MNLLANLPSRIRRCPTVYQLRQAIFYYSINILINTNHLATANEFLFRDSKDE